MLEQSKHWYRESGSKLPINTFLTVDCIKRLWRNDNKNIVQFWYDIENAIRQVINYGVKTEVSYCEIDKINNWLRIKLPSGRYLCYPGIQIKNNTIQYYGSKKVKKEDSKTGIPGWELIPSYGGKFVENIVQAVSRDILASAMLKLDEYGYDIICTVHDEFITEVLNNENFTLEKFINIIKSKNQIMKKFYLFSTIFLMGATLSFVACDKDDDDDSGDSCADIIVEISEAEAAWIADPTDSEVQDAFCAALNKGLTECPDNTLAPRWEASKIGANCE